MDKARIELVELGDAAIGRTIFEPGWHWEKHVKPIVGTATCEVHHLGYVMTGHLHVDMDDGASIDLTEGDVFEVPPGHVAYVVGDVAWTSIDFAGRRLFARSPSEASERKFATIVFTDFRDRPRPPRSWATHAGVCFWPNTTRPRGPRSSASTAGKFKLPAMDSWSCSTTRVGRSRLLARCWTPPEPMGSPPEQASTPVRSRSRAMTCAASPSTWRREFWGSRSLGRCSSRGRSAISSPDPDSSSPTGGVRAPRDRGPQDARSLRSLTRGARTILDAVGW